MSIYFFDRIVVELGQIVLSEASIVQNGNFSSFIIFYFCLHLKQSNKFRVVGNDCI